MIFTHKGRKFDVSGLPIGKSWLGLIYPLNDDETLAGRGLILSEPHAVAPNGPFVYFATEAEAEQAAQNCVIHDLLRD